jgi:hypothetical protein
MILQVRLSLPPFGTHLTVASPGTNHSATIWTCPPASSLARDSAMHPVVSVCQFLESLCLPWILPAPFLILSNRQHSLFEIAATLSMQQETSTTFIAEDAVYVAHHGTFHGRHAIERTYANYFQHWHSINHVSTVDRVIADGIDVRAFGTWSSAFQDTNGAPRKDRGTIDGF